jgi:hypothetical protein
MGRDRDLILKGSPCNVNYFDRKLLTIRQAIEKGETYCGNFKVCDSKESYCALRYGFGVAQNVVKGSTLEKELRSLSESDVLDEEAWNSKEGKKFYTIKGAAKWLDTVEKFARTVLLMNPAESVLPRCDKCYGVKLTKIVTDSFHDGLFPLSGSGKTQDREVKYCPECDPEPIGGIIKGDPRDKEDLNFIRKCSNQNKRND